MTAALPTTGTSTSTSGQGPGDRPLRVLYIVGPGRSGSTLLERALDQAPHVAGVGELAMIWQHGVLGDRRCSCGTAFHDCTFWAEVEARSPGLFDEHAARAIVQGQVRTTRTARLVRAMSARGRHALERQLAPDHVARTERLYRAIQQVSGADTIVDSSKHPFLAWLTGRIEGIDVTYLHLVRDPRATAHSWGRVRLEPGAPGLTMNRYSVLSASVQWTLWNAAALAVTRGQQAALVNYEDFVAEPRRVLDEILADLGHPGLDPTIVHDATIELRPGHAVSGNPMRFTTGATHIVVDDEWKRHMSRRHRALVGFLTAPVRAAHAIDPRRTGRRPSRIGTGWVTLVAHTTQYRHAATALHDAGYLAQFLTVPVLDRPLAAGVVPGRWRRRVNDRRVFPALRGVPMRRLWGGAAFAAASRAVGAMGPIARPVWAEGRMWDLEARLRSSPTPVLHAVDGIAAGTARRARRRGGLVITDLRSAHPTAAGQAGHGIDARDTRLRRAQYDRSDLLVCNSDYTKRTFVEAGFAQERLVVVPLGADLDLFRPAPDPPPTFTVLFVGRFEPAKGAREFAAAVRALPAGCRVVVVGEVRRPHADLLTDIDADVSWVAHVPHVELAEIYRSSSVLVLPSHSDGWGMVVLEAMACGLPVIVTDATGASMVITDGVDGHVVPVADAGAVAGRLAELRADPRAAQAMGAAARTTALDHSWARYGDRLVALYRTIESGGLPRVAP